MFRNLCNITTQEYLASPDGYNVKDCLSYNISNVSCKTVTYIIQKQCEENVHLNIRLWGNSTNNETCLDEIFSDASNSSNSILNVNFPCFVTISGNGSSDKTMISFGCNDTKNTTAQNDTSIFSYLLALNQQTISHNSLDGERYAIWWVVGCTGCTPTSRLAWL